MFSTHPNGGGEAGGDERGGSGYYKEEEENWSKEGRGGTCGEAGQVAPEEGKSRFSVGKKKKTL